MTPGSPAWHLPPLQGSLTHMATTLSRSHLPSLWTMCCHGMGPHLEKQEELAVRRAQTDSEWAWGDELGGLSGGHRRLRGACEGHCPSAAATPGAPCRV